MDKLIKKTMNVFLIYDTAGNCGVRKFALSMEGLEELQKEFPEYTRIVKAKIVIDEEAANG